MNAACLQIPFKHLHGKAIVEPHKDGRASLLLPVRMPPKIFRLPLKGPPLSKPQLDNPHQWGLLAYRAVRLTYS